MTLRVTKKDLLRIIREEAKSTKKYDDSKHLTGDQDELPDNLQKGIIDKAKNEMDESDAAHEPQYDAPQGSKRDKQLDQTKKDFEKAKKLRKDGKSKEAKELEQRAYNRRDRMEKKERKDESFHMTESELRQLISSVLEEELSAKVKKSLDKKAENFINDNTC